MEVVGAQFSCVINGLAVRFRHFHVSTREMPVPPLSELLNTWCDHLRHNRGRAVATVEKYRQTIERLEAWCANPPAEPHLRPSTPDPLKLTPADLNTFCGPFAHSIGLGARARRPVVAAVRGFYRHAFGQRTPAEKLEYPSSGRPLPTPMTLGNAERMLSSCDVATLAGLRDAAILGLFLGCGLRLSGLCALNESALVWTEIADRERLLLRVREKGDRERVLPVPVEATMLLRAYLAHPELRDIDRNTASGDRVLFVSFRNRQVPPHEYHGEARRIATRSVYDMILRRGQSLNIPRDQIHPHALRHLFGTELAESDIDLLQRQALMGHADPKSTEIYTHLASRKLAQSVDRAAPLTKMRGALLDTLRATDREMLKAKRPRVHPPDV